MSDYHKGESCQYSKRLCQEDSGCSNCYVYKNHMDNIRYMQNYRKVVIN